MVARGACWESGGDFNWAAVKGADVTEKESKKNIYEEFAYIIRVKLKSSRISTLQSEGGMQ